MEQNRLQILLDHLAAAARALSEKELEAVVDGRARIHLRVSFLRPRKASRRSDTQDEGNEQVLREAADYLRRMSARQEGVMYLRSNFQNRAELLKLARRLDIPVGNRDPRNRIEEKIVSATIGFRLRSDAIQNRSDED